MGLLAILREKSRLNSGQSGAEECSVAGRAHSEFQTMPASDFVNTYKPSRAKPEQPAEQEPLCVLERQTTKSFTAVRLSPSVTPEQDKVAVSSRPKPWEMLYTKTSQFQQKVELYRGSISTVYRALCTASQEQVIIKMYNLVLMKQKAVQRMEREIALMRLLGGSGVVVLYGVFTDPGHTFLVMEYCKGGDLFKTMLMHGGVLEEQWVCAEIIEPMLGVLADMHRRNILHRDIKPENLFLCEHRKTLKMGDLGLAINANEELPFTRSGTLDYMSPEVLANPTTDMLEGPSITKLDLIQKAIRPYDTKVDVWATGILAYELVVGRPPFEVNDEVQTATNIMYNNKLNFPLKHSALWADFVRRALEKKPHMRPTAADLQQHPWIRAYGRGLPTEPLTIPAAQSTEAVNTVPAASAGTLVPAMATAMAAGAKSDLTRSISAGSHAILFPEQRPGEAKGTGAVDAVQVAVESAWSQPLPLGVIADAGPVRQLKADSQRMAGSGKSSAGAVVVEPSGGSFAALMHRAPNVAQPYIDSGDILGAEERGKGGLQMRMKRYFSRQKNV